MNIHNFSSVYHTLLYQLLCSIEFCIFQHSIQHHKCKSLVRKRFELNLTFVCWRTSNIVCNVYYCRFLCSLSYGSSIVQKILFHSCDESCWSSMAVPLILTTPNHWPISQMLMHGTEYIMMKKYKNSYQCYPICTSPAV